MRDDFDMTTEVSDTPDTTASHPVSEPTNGDDAYTPFAAMPILDSLRASD
ncbi:hypothetical protein [Asticcacaulis tiandongensis]|nr:hypothetical protein [Asticcacaulis tiandongensis]